MKRGCSYVSWTSDADTEIAVRTATVEHGARGGEADAVWVRAGAGIVADFDPESEYEETESKMDGVLTALDRITEAAPAEGEEEGEATLGRCPGEMKVLFVDNFDSFVYDLVQYTNTQHPSRGDSGRLAGGLGA